MKVRKKKEKKGKKTGEFFLNLKVESGSSPGANDTLRVDSNRSLTD